MLCVLIISYPRLRLSPNVRGQNRQEWEMPRAGTNKIGGHRLELIITNKARFSATPFHRHGFGCASAGNCRVGPNRGPAVIDQEPDDGGPALATEPTDAPRRYPLARPTSGWARSMRRRPGVSFRFYSGPRSEQRLRFYVPSAKDEAILVFSRNLIEIHNRSRSGTYYR